MLFRTECAAFNPHTELAKVLFPERVAGRVRLPGFYWRAIRSGRPVASKEWNKQDNRYY